MITMSSAMSYVFRRFSLRGLIIVALCGALGLLSGCSALRIGYATAPDLSYWWLDRYLDFNATQTPRVRQAIRQWFAWNRRTQLPDYAVELGRARAEVLADTTPARVCEWQAEVIERARAAFDHFAPSAADLLLTVTPAQLRHLERHYAKVNEDFRGEYLQPDPRRRAAKNVERTVERAEMLYGRLDASQRARIAEALRRSPFDPEAWLAERRLRQRDGLRTLRRLLAEGADHAQALSALSGYADRLERSPREGYRQYARRLDAFNCAFAADLHNATTAAQRRRAADRLAGWADDLRAIVAAPAAGDSAR
jgi:hypothetical protein